MSEIRHLERATAVEARHAPAPRIADTHAPRTSRLRIALVAEAAGGGVAVHLAGLIDGLSASGDVELHLIVPDGPRFDGKILDERVLSRCASVHRVPMQRAVGWRDALAVFHMYRCLLYIRPDIVHSDSSKAGAIARLCVGPWRHVYTPHAVYTLNPSLGAFQRRFYGTIERLLGRLRQPATRIRFPSPHNPMICTVREPGPPQAPAVPAAGGGHGRRPVPGTRGRHRPLHWHSPRLPVGTAAGTTNPLWM